LVQLGFGVRMHVMPRQAGDEAPAWLTVVRN
jgi:hypothetical protein